MGLANGNRSAKCLGEVYDNNGVVQSGEEAVKVWSEHFREVLQGGSESSGDCSEASVHSQVSQGEQCGSSCGLNEELTGDEVMWALAKAKKRKSPGRDGILLSR